MNALMANWSGLSAQRKVALAAAVLTTLFLTFYIARTATQPQMALLYGGLDQRSAGQVVAALDGLGVRSEVRGDQIFVPEGARDRARLDLARQGLPQMGQAGYELLDQLSGFGTTSEMFQAAYWRAKEGELARTILSVPGVRSARVHIGASSRRPFGRNQQKATAAVTVRTNGGALSEQTAVSIRYLVALAVSNLDASQVAVIDADNGVVLRPGEEKASAAADAAAERRAAQLKLELERLLTVRVGPDNVQVSVAVELRKETETISQRLVDPESGVPVQTEIEAQTESSVGSNAAVTVASDLPDGDAAAGGQNNSERERTREQTTFKYSETRRDEVREAGGVKRIGVAVLVNQAASVAEDGTVTYQERSPEELKAISELVKSAIAFDANRGDVVTVESMQFAATPELGSEASVGSVGKILEDNLMTLIQLAVLALVALGLGLFVVRPIMAAGPAAAPELTEDPGEETEALAAPAAGGALAPVEGAERAAQDGSERVQSTEEGEGQETRALPNMTEQALAIGAPGPEKADNSTIDRLRVAIDDRSEESLQLLSRWLNPDEKGEGAQA